MFDRTLTQKNNPRFFAFSILLFLIVFFPKSAIFSQQTDFIEYKVIGKVLDDNGKPVKDAPVIVYPNSPICNYITYARTDENGYFEEKVSVKKGETWYLYTSETSRLSKSEKELFFIPFCVNKTNDKYLGKPIIFGNEKIIDVGNVNVQFWFGAVYPKLKIKDENLTKEQWLQIWIRLLDEEGTVVAEESVAPTVKDDEIDVKNSLLKLSLPEGKWKLEFQKFDYDQNKIYPEIIGETPYFTIDKNKKPEEIEVKITL